MISDRQSGSATIRVAHLTPTHFSPASVVGGGERYVFNLASALAEADLARQFEQVIFALGDTEAFSVHDGIPVRLLRNENPSLNAMDSISTQLWRELGSFHVLHVHQCLTVFGAHACVLARSLGKTLIVTDLGGGENPVMTVAKGLELADAAVSISRYAHSLIAADFSGPAEILIGPVDTVMFAPSGALYNGPPRALCVSRILPHKGIHRVIRALPPGLSLTIVGRVYDKAYYDLLRELARSKEVTFIHDADDEQLCALYREATVFVQASTMTDHEGRIVAKPELMGLSTLEALSSGLPALVSDVGSFPELAVDPAFCRNFTNDAALETALAQVAAGAWPRPGASALARRHVVEHHSYAIIGARLAEFYRQVHHAAAGQFAA
jgi:glycosyltransferase involved in cell wall biosynthesis